MYNLRSTKRSISDLQREVSQIYKEKYLRSTKRSHFTRYSAKVEQNRFWTKFNTITLPKSTSNELEIKVIYIECTDR